MIINRNLENIYWRIRKTITINYEIPKLRRKEGSGCDENRRKKTHS